LLGVGPIPDRAIGVKSIAHRAKIPLSTGWGPVGDKQFMCSRCGEVTDLIIRL